MVCETQKNMNSLLFSFLVILLVIKCQEATESPETESYTNQSDQNIDVITAYNKTVSELVNEQTEAIRKIISAAHNPEYDPELPKAEEDKNNQKLQEDSIEQLKEKCEQHFKISGNKHNDKFEELGDVKLIVPLAQPINPQYVQHPESISPLLFSLYANNQVFPNKKTEEKPIVTQQNQDQQFSQAQTDQQLYLTKLTPPVISQQPPNFHKDANKPIYLTKIAPVVIPQAYQNHHLQATNNENVATKFKIAGQINSEDSEHFQNHHLHQTTNENVQASTATKFKIPAQTNPEESVKTQNFDYVQLEPVWLQKTVLSDGRIFYYWFRKVSQVPAETTAYSANEKLQNVNLLHPQLKFVLPILPASSEVVSKDQWNFEPHGYYSKTVKSNFRSPTLHMIRALKVPNLSEKGKEEVQAKLDDVSVE